MSLRRSDHDLAADAMRALNRVRKDLGGSVSPQVLTRLASLPAMLRTSGVLPSLAYYTAKQGKKKALEKAYGIVGVEVRAQISAVLGWEEDGRPSLDLSFLDKLTLHLQEHPASAGLLSVRLEHFAVWLSRLSEALEREQKSTSEAERADA
ncbi:type III-B CRISPR module-associated protein Cmr5 [Nonomuraea sp. NPDC049419]|uniref:type III-B CRISPR module-associated protein Cmr5 n=1 Tax=Nonomuraea sp. NPDC049419 TaxID=3155772 RepID=UPI003443DE89